MGVQVTLGRVVTLIVIAALASIALTIVLSNGGSSESKHRTKTIAPPSKTVPGVVGQPYVFAEGTLQEHGFGWKVAGRVAGWSEAIVASQDPVGGTEVIDTGAPLVILRLSKPKGYVTQGTPQNSSPYAGTKILYSDGSSGNQPTTTYRTTTTQTTSTSTTTSTTTSGTKKRPPAFTVAGAKPEPLDEIPLPQRARELSAWLDSHSAPSAANEKYWLFQHAWIVTGARFGWWHGAQALETLIAVDRRVEQLWGVGSKSEAEARSALEFVRAQGG